MNSKERLDLIKKLGDSDWKNRVSAWSILVQEEREKTAKYFASRLAGNNNVQFGIEKELVSDVCERVINQLRKKALLFTNENSYRSYMAHVCKSTFGQFFRDKIPVPVASYSQDEWLQETSEIDEYNNPFVGQALLTESQSPENRIIDAEMTQLRQEKYATINSQIFDRSIVFGAMATIITTVGKFSPLQLAKVTGIGRTTSYRHIGQTKKMVWEANPDDFYKADFQPIHRQPTEVVQPSCWGPTANYGWSWICPPLVDLHPDTEHQLMKAVGVKSMPELWEHFDPVLVVLSDPRGVRPMLTFLERRNLTRRLFENGKLHYLGGTLEFVKEKPKRINQEKIILSNVDPVEAWMDKFHYDEADQLTHVEWIYAQPGGRLRICKPFDESLVNRNVKSPSGRKFVYMYETSNESFLAGAYH